MQNLEEYNAVYLCGTVEDTPVCDHVLYGESFYTFMLSVARLSGVNDLLPVTLPGRVAMIPQKKDRIVVEGQLRSYKKHFENGSRLFVTVFAKKISYALREDENRIELSGFLCRPVVFRTTPFLREISDMLLAVNRPYSKSDYIPCIAWGRNARFARDFSVGTELHISGRLQSRLYTKTLPNGETAQRTTYEVSCTSIAAFETDTDHIV